MKLTDLLRNRADISGFVTNDALGAARAKMQKERQERVAEQLSYMLDEFMDVTEQELRESTQLTEQARVKAEAAEGMKRALDYFGATGNPLPFFASSFNKPEGKQWCENNGIDIPGDKDPAWVVPADWTAEATESPEVAQ